MNGPCGDGKAGSMGRRNYKFTNKKHPWQAAASLILGCISFVSMGAVIWMAFQENGGTRPGYGMTGLLAVCFTLAGTILGLVSLREKDCYHILGWLGTFVNLLVLLGTGWLYYLGM